jgi:hypothetical protein
MLDSILHAFIIDAESIDDCLVCRHSEASRLRISILRLRGKGTDLDESEAEVRHVVVEFTVFIQSAGQSYRVRKGYAEYFLFKLR